MSATRPFDVCVVGSANVDLVVHAARHPSPGETVLGTSYAEHPGGKGLNQAVAAARAGARTAMVGALGRDPAADLLERVLVAEAVAHEAVRRVDAPTGRAVITVSRRGENTIVVVPGANALVEVGELPTAAVLLAQLEVPLAEVNAAVHTARAAGALTVLNPAPAMPLPDDLLAAVDVIVPNAHEVRLLGGADALLARGAGVVVTTLGPRGAMITDHDGTRHVESVLVTPIDTTGAGDAFCGMLAARLAGGATVDEAVPWATAAGALATTVAGAVPSIPTHDQVVALRRPDERSSGRVSGAGRAPPTRP
jgi:ribokinase